MQAIKWLGVKKEAVAEAEVGRVLQDEGCAPAESKSELA